MASIGAEAGRIASGTGRIDMHGPFLLLPDAVGTGDGLAVAPVAGKRTMGGKVRLQPLLRADLQQQAGGEVIAVSVGIRAESRIDVDELPTHHRQPVGVGQGAFIGQQQAMVVLRQTRVIGSMRASGNLKCIQ